jgi:hypothetical protein
MSEESDAIQRRARDGVWIRVIAPSLAALATVAIAVLTYFYVDYSGKQWRAMTDSLKLTADSLELARQSLKLTVDSLELARQSHELDARAWLIVKSIKLVQLSTAKIVSADVVIQNSGKTPLTLIGIDTRIQVASTFPRVLPGGRTTSVASVGAGHDHFLRMQTDGPISAEGIENIAQRRTTIWLWGILTYQDVFKKTRHTKFCAWWNQAKDSFTFCSEHDEWD